MSQPKLPLEIRSIIYNLQDDFNLAKQSSNCFWAIAPHYFKNLTIGLGFEEDADILLQTELAGLWSDTGRFVETLTLHPENSRLSLSSIGFFLRNNENFEKLTHLRLSSSSDDFELASELPFHDPLVNCLKKMKNLTRFSFINIQPCSILMGAAGETLTRVDFGYGFPRNNDDYICLPGKIQILTLTSSAAPLLYGAPENLRVLILKDDVHYPDFAGDVYRIIDACPRLTSLALVDPWRGITSLVRHSRIRNVCFQFKYGDIRSIPSLSTNLKPDKISFSSSTFLLRLDPEEAEVYAQNKETLRTQAQEFTRRFNLNSTFISCCDDKILPEGGEEEILNEWIRIMD